MRITGSGRGGATLRGMIPSGEGLISCGDTLTHLYGGSISLGGGCIYGDNSLITNGSRRCHRFGHGDDWRRWTCFYNFFLNAFLKRSLIAEIFTRALI